MADVHFVFDAAPEMEGEWAGWVRLYGVDPFEDFVGPFHFQEDAAGATRCALRLEARHANGLGRVHGGCLMTLADLSLFAIARRVIGSAAAVTVSMNSTFVGPAMVGQVICATGEVVRAGRSLIFVRGLISTSDPVFAFSGVVKKLRPGSGKTPLVSEPASSL